MIPKGDSNIKVLSKFYYDHSLLRLHDTCVIEDSIFDGAVLKEGVG